MPHGMLAQATPFATRLVSATGVAHADWIQIEVARNQAGFFVRCQSILPPLAELVESPWDAHLQTEEARKRLRLARDDVWSDIQEKERNGDITEDDKFRMKDEMQKMVDDIVTVSDAQLVATMGNCKSWRISKRSSWAVSRALR